jgi:hypothetical protein
MEPAEVSSLKSILGIARIVALVFMIIFLLAGLASLGVALAFAAVGFGGLGLVFAILPILFFVINLIIWMQVGEIRRMVDAGRYQEAKSKSLIWMILGFILGGLIIGILLLIAYLKFDPVINWQRQQQAGGQPPAQGGWVAPPPAAPPMAPPMAPVAATAPPAPAAGTCPRCGKPATWVAQYNRWYCYGCQQYV